MSQLRLIAGKENNSQLTFSTKQYTVDIFGREKFTNFQIPSIRFYFPANRFHEAWYFHTISQNSRHTVRFVQLSDQGKAESHMTPILRAVEQIRKLEPEVILLYSNKQNIELTLQQVKVPVQMIPYLLYVFIGDSLFTCLVSLDDISINDKTSYK